MAPNQLVLVTGGSGFVGSHSIIALLREGYRVRTTLRSLKRADEVRNMLQAGGVTEEQAKSVEIRVADLGSDDGWSEACKDCEYILHVASPLPTSVPKNPDDLIIPARDGVLRVLKAAKAAGTVKRVVMTSSEAAIDYGHAPTKEPFTEKDWTELNNSAAPVAPYPKSKTIAERAAWNWIAKERGEMELTVINPVAIFGPLLGKDYAASVELVSRLMNGQLPGLPQFGFTVVDVRDVADLHVRAMTNPKAKGERFLAASDTEFLWTKDMASILKNRLGEKARKVPTRSIPNFVLRLTALFDGAVAVVVPELGIHKEVSNDKAKSVLDWRPRTAEEALVSTAESLDHFGMLKR